MGLVGSLAGLLVGVLFSRLMPALLTFGGLARGTGALGARVAQSQGAGGLTSVELAITPSVVSTSVAIGVLVAAIAGLLPAYRASKMRPAEAVRYV